MQDRDVPALTALLGFVAPGWERAEGADAMGPLAEAAAEAGLATGAGAKAAARFLSRAAGHALPHRTRGTPERLARFLGVEGPPPSRAAVAVETTDPGVHRASVRFRAAPLRADADAAVSGGWSGSRFEAAFGPMPEAVAARAGIAAERPLLAPLLLATAADALVAEALLLAARLPGSVRDEEGVLWRHEDGRPDGWLAALDWLALDGPAALASEVVLGVPQAFGDWHVRLAGHPPGAGRATPGETA